MENKLKTLQKLLKNSRIPYIYLVNNRLYATTGGDLGVYVVEDSVNKMWDIGTLEEVPMKDFPNLDNVKPILSLCTENREVNKKELIDTLKQVKEYIKNNKEHMRNKDRCSVEITKNSVLTFKILTKHEIKTFDVKLTHTHVLPREFRGDFYWNNIYKYVKLCKGKTINIRYNEGVGTTPLIFKDNVICEYVTMPMRFGWEEGV